MAVDVCPGCQRLVDTTNPDGRPFARLAAIDERGDLMRGSDGQILYGTYHPECAVRKASAPLVEGEPVPVLLLPW